MLIYSIIKRERKGRGSKTYHSRRTDNIQLKRIKDKLDGFKQLESDFKQEQGVLKTNALLSKADRNKKLKDGLSALDNKALVTLLLFEVGF
jgi:hypothetical protein